MIYSPVCHRFWKKGTQREATRAPGLSQLKLFALKNKLQDFQIWYRKRLKTQFIWFHTKAGQASEYWMNGGGFRLHRNMTLEIWGCNSQNPPVHLLGNSGSSMPKGFGSYQQFMPLQWQEQEERKEFKNTLKSARRVVLLWFCREDVTGQQDPQNGSKKVAMIMWLMHKKGDGALITQFVATNSPVLTPSVDW